MTQEDRAAPSTGALADTGLGTFGGVFTPSILTILGLVLFLRVAYVVGSVGVVQGLVIVGLATSVSVLTSISLATVATNLRVRGGGEYFLISRTLGIEFGGAVGVVLYLAISVSIAFYAIGFAEAVAGALGHDSGGAIQVIAAMTVLALLGVGLVGADLATRLQYLVMGLLVVALVSFFAGGIGQFDADVFADNAQGVDAGVGFWEAFAIFFPAVTGFSQGVAMSGDLRDPSRSITIGTFAAVALSTVVYVAAVIVLAGSAPAAVLVADTTTIMGDVSLAGWTILVGVLAATVSSALASTLGAPRVLQRLGEDRVLPHLELFAVGAGRANNPRRATMLSAAIALAIVAVGDLNAIAPIISMFFLTSYGLINYATYYEIRAESTSFRPRFRWHHYRLSLAGTLGCGIAILAINPLAGALAGVVLALLYSYLRRRDVPDRWSDSAGAFHYTRARKHLRQLADEPVGHRDWRPCVLVFVPRDPANRRRLLELSTWLEGDVGYLTAVRMLEGTSPQLRRQASQVESELTLELAEVSPGGYARVLAVGDLEVGVPALVQAHGIGAVRPNLAVFGVRDLRGSADEQREYGQMLQGCARLGTNVAVVNVDEHAWQQFEATPLRERTIALWWSDDRVGQLITLLAWLCKRSPEWAHARVVAHVPVTDDPAESARVAALLEAARIPAEIVQVTPTAAALADSLGRATLALAPLRVRRGRALGPLDTPLGMLIESLPIAVMVLAIEELALDAEPDDRLAELAEISDQVARSQRWVAELDAKASGLLVEAERLRLELAAAPPGERDRLRAAVQQAEAEATKAFRAYLDAKARVDALAATAGDHVHERPAAPLDPAIWRSATSPGS